MRHGMLAASARARADRLALMAATAESDLPANRPGLQAFGLRLITDIPLPGRWRTPAKASDRVLEICLDASVPQALADSTREWAAPIDGAWLTLERGGDGSFLFRHETGRHLLSADTRSLRCLPRDERDPAWFRVLLDSVLLCTALLGGQEGLHAGSVSVGDGTVAIVAAAGGGKSTLVSELVARGHELVSDDITFLEPRVAASPLALPGAPVMTLPLAVAPPTEAEILLELPGERWVSATVGDTPSPLLAIVQLARRPGAAVEMRSDGDAARTLLSALLALPRTPERALERLDLASTLASRCRILTLNADSTTSPAQLAELVERALAPA
jgi:hypothetical protein